MSRKRKCIATEGEEQTGGTSLGATHTVSRRVRDTQQRDHRDDITTKEMENVWRSLTERSPTGEHVNEITGGGMEATSYLEPFDTTKMCERPSDREYLDNDGDSWTLWHFVTSRKIEETLETTPRNCPVIVNLGLAETLSINYVKPDVGMVKEFIRGFEVDKSLSSFRGDTLPFDREVVRAAFLLPVGEFSSMKAHWKGVEMNHIFNNPRYSGGKYSVNWLIPEFECWAGPIKVITELLLGKKRPNVASGKIMYYFYCYLWKGRKVIGGTKKPSRMPDWAELVHRDLRDELIVMKKNLTEGKKDRKYSCNIGTAVMRILQHYGHEVDGKKVRETAHESDRPMSCGAHGTHPTSSDLERRSQGDVGVDLASGDNTESSENNGFNSEKVTNVIEAITDSPVQLNDKQTITYADERMQRRGAEASDNATDVGCGTDRREQLLDWNDEGMDRNSPVDIGKQCGSSQWEMCTQQKDQTPVESGEEKGLMHVEHLPTNESVTLESIHGLEQSDSHEGAASQEEVQRAATLLTGICGEGKDIMTISEWGTGAPQSNAFHVGYSGGLAGNDEETIERRVQITVEKSMESRFCQLENKQNEMKMTNAIVMEEMERIWRCLKEKQEKDGVAEAYKKAESNVHVRTESLVERETELGTWEKIAADLEQQMSKRLQSLEEREKTVAANEEAYRKAKEDVEARGVSLNKREIELVKREKDANMQCNDIEDRHKKVEEGVEKAESRRREWEGGLDEREKELQTRHEALQGRLRTLEEKEKTVEAEKEACTKGREDVEKRKVSLNKRETELLKREEDTKLWCDDIEERHKKVGEEAEKAESRHREREDGLDEREKQLQTRHETLEEKEKTVEAKEEACRKGNEDVEVRIVSLNKREEEAKRAESRHRGLDDRENELQTRERVVAEKARILELREEQVRATEADMKSISANEDDVQKHLDKERTAGEGFSWEEQFRSLELVSNQLKVKMHILETKWMHFKTEEAEWMTVFATQQKQIIMLKRQVHDLEKQSSDTSDLQLKVLAMEESQENLMKILDNALNQKELENVVELIRAEEQEGLERAKQKQGARKKAEKDKRCERSPRRRDQVEEGKRQIDEFPYEIPLRNRRAPASASHSGPQEIARRAPASATHSSLQEIAVPRIILERPYEDGPEDEDYAFSEDEWDDSHKLSDWEERSSGKAHWMAKDITYGKHLKKMDDPPRGHMVVRPQEHQRAALAWMKEREKANTATPRGGILADDPGMGKTISMLMLMLTERGQGKPTLVVAPASVLTQWGNEVENKCSRAASMTYLIYSGNVRERDVKVVEAYDVVICSYGVIKAELKTQRDKRISSPLHTIRWHRVILDEAQDMKNYDCAGAKACYNLKAERRWCLTGTPLQNAIVDFYSYFRFLRYPMCENFEPYVLKLSTECEKNPISGIPKFRRHLNTIMIKRDKGILALPQTSAETVYMDFNSDLEKKLYDRIWDKSLKAIQDANSRGGKKEYAWGHLLRMRLACVHPWLAAGKPVDAKKVKEKLKKLRGKTKTSMEKAVTGESIKCTTCKCSTGLYISSVCLHKYCGVCYDEWSEENVTCPVRACNRKVDREYEVFTPEELFGDNIVEYDGAGISSKMEWVLEYIRNLPDITPQPVGGGGARITEKVLVFSQWTKALDLLQAKLVNEGDLYRRVDGQMELPRRAKHLSEFTKCMEIKVMLLSLKAANVGLNIVAANHIILLDNWWNPTVEDQAIDRAHRIGQTRNVIVRRLIMKGTVEERIENLQEESERFIEQCLG